MQFSYEIDDKVQIRLGQQVVEQVMDVGVHRLLLLLLYRSTVRRIAVIVRIVQHSDQVLIEIEAAALALQIIHHDRHAFFRGGTSKQKPATRLQQVADVLDADGREIIDRSFEDVKNRM